MAREIHDELGQGLVALKLDVALLLKQLPEGDSQIRAQKEAITSLLHRALDTVRDVSSRLRPALLDDVGLEAAIEWEATKFGERTGVACSLNVDLPEPQPDRQRATAVYRILQETLTNIARHADATRVEISLQSRDNYVVLQVRDDGSGITEDEATNSRSLGLIGMCERASALGGEVEIHRAPEGGTVMTLKMPFSEADGTARRPSA